MENLHIFQRNALVLSVNRPSLKERVHHENAINLQCEQVRRVPRNKHGMLGREERDLQGRGKGF